MAKSLSQLKSQIEKLQKEAAVIQSRIVTRMKKEIAEHGLTVEHLFGSAAASASEKSGPTKTSAKAGPKKARTSYADQNGNSWSGFGPRPAWLRAAVEAGKSLEDFMAKRLKAAVAKNVKAAKPVTTKSAVKPTAPAKKTAKPTKATKAKIPAATPMSKPKAVASKKVVVAKAAPAKKAVVVKKKPAKAAKAAATSI